jgi:tetratricopeptide (TPR) repeat protein
MLELNPLNGRALSLGAGALQRDGQNDRALEWARRAVEQYPDDMGVVINAALVHLRLGMKEQSLDLMEIMFNKGWAKKDWVENDPDYDPLRTEPRFIAMMAKLK